MSPVRVAAICSTGGSVVRFACRADPLVADRLVGIVTDRACGAEDVAAELGRPAVRIEERASVDFGRRASDALGDLGADVAVVFFTRLLAGELLDRYRDRLFNFHPSILPAFPGLHGFEDALAAGARVVGTTVHLVDPGMDTGTIVCQTSVPVDDRTIPALRHALFVDQVRSLVQLVHWLDEDRLRIEGRRSWVVEAPDPVAARHVPPLDAPAALGFDPPRPD